MGQYLKRWNVHGAIVEALECTWRNRPVKEVHTDLLFHLRDIQRQTDLTSTSNYVLAEISQRTGFSTSVQQKSKANVVADSF